MGRQRARILRLDVISDGDLVTKRAPSRSARTAGAKRHQSDLNALEFPALAAFLKGYLHQDFPDEHGSVAAAVAAFCRDASPHERRQAATELARLVGLAEALPLRAVGQFVTRDLGSAWSPRSTRDLVDILAALRQLD